MSARMLIVDDDQGQLRMLARLISMRRRDITVLTACDGREAVEVLETGPVDMVLTDLQMPEMNGFELLAWMATHQPHVHVFTMTAYPDTAAVDRLGELGSLECFTKPIDLPELFERLTALLEEGARGHVHNIGLPSFLQLLEMERETCTLTVESEQRVGHLYLESGSLIAARMDGLEGRDAAVSIISWPSPAITILSTPPTHPKAIDEPLSFLIMESMRVEDERARSDAAPSDEPLEPERAGVAGPVLDAELPAYVRAAAIVSIADGGSSSQASVGDWSEVESLCRAAAQLFEPLVEEIVLTGPRFWLVARPVSMDTRSLAVVAFDCATGSLVGAREALCGVVSAYASAGC